MQLEFASATVSLFVHSTEDADRLISSVSRSLGLWPEELHMESIQGHFGNPIISVRAHVIGRRAQEVALVILGGLSSKAKSQIRSEIEKSLDEHDALYLRIDRQQIHREILLSDEEPIRIKLKPKLRVGGRESMKRSYLEVIG